MGCNGDLLCATAFEGACPFGTVNFVVPSLPHWTHLPSAQAECGLVGWVAAGGCRVAGDCWWAGSGWRESWWRVNLKAGWGAGEVEWAGYRRSTAET